LTHTVHKTKTDGGIGVQYSYLEETSSLIAIGLYVDKCYYWTVHFDWTPRLNSKQHSACHYILKAIR